MELKGKDACIMFKDADLDLVAANIVKGVFSYRCTTIKVVLVMESVADVLSSANFIEGLVWDAKKKEAIFRQEYKKDGNLIWPLLLDNVRPDMWIAWEEQFGPILPVIRINSNEEGIHHCNASNFELHGLKDSGIGSKEITNNINMMTKIKSTVINLPTPSFTMG
ncbi:hypothetical protein DITRI_Ditri03aG0021400 [Diplodiscus trichospermus]